MTDHANNSTLTRRKLVQTTLGGAAAGVMMPAFLKRAYANGPIKIGMPLALTGPIAGTGHQQKRSMELFAKKVNANGGLLGRELQGLFVDTAGNPATCVRVAREMVEKEGCRLFAGITYSSEALAVLPKLKAWNAIFVSVVCGDGRLTASSFVPNFFRPNISGPMGDRTVSLYLKKSPLKKFFAIGMDYAWGHNSVNVFESEIKSMGREFVGKVFSPTGTKDFSSYITKIRRSGADALYVVLAGDDNNAFMTQAHQYRLSEKVQILNEIVDLHALRAVGDAALGLVGSSRYSFTFDNPENKKFVAMWKKHFGKVPDTFEGEQWQSMSVLATGIKKAGTIEADPLREAMEGLTINSIKGKLTIRKCDHQGVQDGFMVKAVKRAGFDFPVPEVIVTYPASEVVPACRQMTYKS